MRPKLGVATLLALSLTSLTSCGGDDQDTSEPETPSANSESGQEVDDSPEVVPATTEFTYSSITVRSDLVNSEKGDTGDPRLLALTCEDPDCTSLLQRGGGSGALSFSVRLTGDNRLVGTHTRTGTCAGGDGQFEDSTSWTWTRKSKSMTGTAVYTFAGCGLDGSATNKVTATLNSMPSLVDLPEPQAEQLAASLGDYDEVLGQFYTDYNECQTDPEAVCFSKAFRPWKAGVEVIEAVLKDISTDAEGICETTLRENQLTPLLKSLEKAVRPTGDNSDRNRAATLSGHSHTWLTTVTKWCTPPDAISAMTEPYSFDLSSALPPLDG